MSWIHALLEVIKADITQEYMRVNSCRNYHELFDRSPSGQLVLENVEMSVRGLSNLGDFPKKLSEKYEDLDEIIESYCATGDDQFFQDSVKSSSCCKRLNYFLFTNQAKNFGLEQRNRFAEIVRKNENLAQEKMDAIRESKRIFYLQIEDKLLSSSKVHTQLGQYLALIGALLQAQNEIYSCEESLGNVFLKYVNQNMVYEMKDGQKVKSETVSSFLATVKSIEKRGVEITAVHAPIKQEQLKTFIEEYKEHLGIVKDEVGRLEDFTNLMHKIARQIRAPDLLVDE